MLIPVYQRIDTFKSDSPGDMRFFKVIQRYQTEGNKAMKDATVEASSHKAGTSNTQSNDQSEITEQLLAALMSIQQTEQQIL